MIINEIAIGDVFSEETHYIVDKRNTNSVVFRNLKDNTKVELSNDYVTKFLKTADQYEKEVIVNKEDSKWTASSIATAVKDGSLPKNHSVMVGDVRLGIRSIWNNIQGSQVFSVCFKKADSDKKKSEIDAEKKAIMDKLSKSINNPSAVKELVNNLLDNPILSYNIGEDRELRGYKLQFSSDDGRYDCVDMDIDIKTNNIRPVNINTIKWLVYNGVKYIVKQ